MVVLGVGAVSYERGTPVPLQGSLQWCRDEDGAQGPEDSDGDRRERLNGTGPSCPLGPLGSPSSQHRWTPEMVL